jgi:phosphatidylglycerol:prolipoprotein diacylglycerol transferase
MLPILQIGPLKLRTPGLALLAGLWIGLEIASREGARRGIDPNRVYNLGFTALIAGLLGARLGFVALNLRLYAPITPWTRLLTSVFALVPGTENVWVGLIVAVVAVVYLLRRWQVDPLDAADAFSPGLAVFAVGVGLANLLSGHMAGVETSMPWGIELWGARRQPTQIFSMLGAAATFVALWRLRDRLPPGALMQVLVILLSLTILLVEPLRADSPVVGPGLRVWLIVAVVTLVGALAGFAARAPVRPPE